MIKRCRICGQSKALNKFDCEPRNRDGRSGRCIECRNEYQRARRVPMVKQCIVCGEKFHPWGKQKACSPEHAKIRQMETKARWNAKPENKKRRAAMALKYYWANPEKAKENHRRWKMKERLDPLRRRRRRIVQNLWLAANRYAINEKRKERNKQKGKLIKYAREILKQTGVEL